MLLSTLAEPWRGPVLLAGFVGAACHLTLSWFALWIVSGCAVMFLGGTGIAILARRQSVAMRAVFDNPDFELSRVPISSFPVLAQATRQLGQDPGASPDDVLRIYAARGKTRAARLKFTTRCLVGGADSPSVILIPQVPTSAEAQFELLHELGHAGHPALHAEVVALLDPTYICMVALLAFAVAGPSAGFAAWCSAWLVLRFFHWAMARRTGIEAEVLADTFAYDVLEATHQSFVGVLPYAEAWARNANRAHTFAVRVQSRARLRCFRGRSLGQKIPMGVVQYSPIGLIPTIGLVLGPFFCPDRVWGAVFGCLCVILIQFVISSAFTKATWSDERTVC